MQVVQPRLIVILPDEAFGRVDTARVVAPTGIRPEQLVALEGGPACRVGEGRDDAAQRVAQIELRPVAVQRTDSQANIPACTPPQKPLAFSPTKQYTLNRGRLLTAPQHPSLPSILGG